MPDTFEFTIANSSLQLGTDRTGSVGIDVTSRLGRHGVVGVEVQPGEGADAGWFGRLEPAEFDLPDGETLRTTVPIAVPDEAAAGDYQFSLRAYSIHAPQQDFTDSPTISMTVPPPGEPPGIPKWIFIVIGVVILLIVLALVYFLFLRGDDDPPEGQVRAPNVVAETVTEARDEVGVGATFAAFLAPGVDEASACVLLQVPPAGDETPKVSVLGVTCPTPAPAIAVPEANEPCTASFDFCGEVREIFGPQFQTDEEWLTEALEMTTEFIEAFTIDGDEVPNVIGMPRDAAIAEIDDSFQATAIADGSGGDQCVLFQHPFAGDLVATGDEVVLVTTRCPGNATTPDAVVLSTPIDVTTFGNVCAQAPALCTSADSTVLGPDFSTMQEFRDALAAMVSQFRNAFTSDVVPAVTGLLLGAAEDELEARGLEPVPVFPPPDPNSQLFFPCWRVTSQNPNPGALIADLDSTAVGLFLQGEFCLFLQIEDINVSTELLLETVGG